MCWGISQPSVQQPGGNDILSFVATMVASMVFSLSIMVLALKQDLAMLKRKYHLMPCLGIFPHRTDRTKHRDRALFPAQRSNA